MERKGKRKQGRRRGRGKPKGRSTPGLVAKRRFTPEDRRGAVEAFYKSGLSRHAFARQWGLSHVTLGVWVRKYEKDGPKGLERLAEGPPRRRGKAPLPAALRAEVVAARRGHPEFGWKRLRDWLWRFAGLRVSTSSIRRVSAAANLPAARPAARRRPRERKPPRRFERARPGELWQSDITYLNVPWRRGPLYLIVWLDDHSRYVVGWGLYTHQRAEIVLDTFQEACGRFPRPKEALTDQGRQYYAWRGKSAFTKLCDQMGVKHVVARSHHPATVGKCERLWGTVKRELWERVRPHDLDEARTRLRHFFGHYNHHRPSQALDGLVPADRFFGVAEDVRRAIEKTVAKNALRLALGELPRKPLFLVGQIDGQAVSLHGEAGRIVVQTPDGEVRALETKDLGSSVGQVKEVDDGENEHDPAADGGDAEGGEDARLDGGARESDGDEPNGAATPGPEAHDVPGAEEGAGAGAGAVEERERGGAGDGAPDGHDGAQGLAGEDHA